MQDVVVEIRIRVPEGAQVDTEYKGPTETGALWHPFKNGFRREIGNLIMTILPQDGKWAWTLVRDGLAIESGDDAGSPQQAKVQATRAASALTK